MMICGTPPERIRKTKTYKFDKEEGLLKMLQLLVSRGADMNIVCSFSGRTALSYAVENSYRTIVEYLLEHTTEQARRAVDRVCVV